MTVPIAVHLARATGGLLAVPFALVAAARRGRALHPEGVTLRGHLRIADDPLRPGTGYDGPALVRLSRSAGLPPGAPDVHGIAVRWVVDGAAHDLLLASTGTGVPGCFLLTVRRTPWCATFAGVPVRKLSSATTCAPRSTSSVHRWLPRNPAPPVTTTRPAVTCVMRTSVVRRPARPGLSLLRHDDPTWHVTPPPLALFLDSDPAQRHWLLPMLNTQEVGMSPESAVTVTVLVLVALSPLVVLLRDARTGVAYSTEAARALRHAVMPAGVGVAVLLLGLAAAVTLLLGAFPVAGLRVGGRVLALLPMGGAVACLAVHAVGELTFPRPSGAVRTADLTARRVGDVAPRRLVAWVGAWSATLVALLGVGLLTATAPRHVDRVIDGWISRGDPYPGSWYALPLGIGAAVLLLATWGALHLVATRPAVEGVAPAWDSALRGRTAARLLRGVQLGLAVTVAGLLLMYSWSFRGLAQPMPTLGDHTAEPVFDVLAGVTLVLGMGVLLAGLVVAALRGAPRLPATAPAAVDA